MGDEVNENTLLELIDKNIPFVLFRESGQEAKILFQTKPLEMDGNVQFKKRGFYAFPFSSRENSVPLFFNPEHLLIWKDFSKLKIELLPLEEPFIKPQNLYEVSHEEYNIDLEKFIDEFKNNRIKKAIYSRIRKENLAKELDLELFFERLLLAYPKAFVYIMNIPGDGIWIGASPELLLSFHNNKARTSALAGTLKIDENISSPDWTNKEIDEQQLVEQHIISLCDELRLNYEKSKVRSSNTGKMYHLKSDFLIDIKVDQIVNFLERLHPTPAISGLPQQESLDLIYTTEKHERSYYSGFLGWVDNIDNFSFFINLRCMKIVGKQCFLFAGGGITPDSKISNEWEETKLKMSTLADVLHKNMVISLQ